MTWKYSNLFHDDERKLFAKQAALLTRSTDPVHQVNEEEETCMLPLDTGPGRDFQRILSQVEFVRWSRMRVGGGR